MSRSSRRHLIDGRARRQGALHRARRASHAVAAMSIGAAAALGLVVSRQIPGTTASAAPVAKERPRTTITGTATTTSAGTVSSTPSTTSGSGSSSGISATTTTAAPSSTSRSATVVSGGTGR